MRPGAIAAIVSIAILVVLALASCGDEKTFTPEDFVAEMNEVGAGIVLGDVLTTNEAGVDVQTIIFSDATGESTRGGEEGQGSGTLLAFEGVTEAETDFARCGGAPSLICFRTANVVLRFEDLAPADNARVTAALQSLAAEE